MSAAVASADSIELRSGWRFFNDNAEGAEQPNFDDSSWSIVRVPHDWAIAGPFDAKLDGSTGKRPWRGVGWYRTTFSLDQHPDDRVYLDFDGVMAFPKVYVNGHLAGEWDYGYTSFRIDATPFVNLNGTNVVAVRVDTTKHVSRWYPGAGIYRKVTLQLDNPVHIGQWGIFTTTTEVSDEAAALRIRSKVENHHEKTVPATVEYSLISPGDDGETIAMLTRPVRLLPGENNFEESIRISQPELWDVESPNLYTLRTTVRTGGDISDKAETPFGIRTFKFTADDGFHINGRRLQLYGVNLHHDQGPLGAAFNVRAMQRQLEIMREMGANAIRTSHNPAAPELLDLCDRMGFLVWEECFDKWDGTAGRIDGKPTIREHGQRHLRSMVLRDRNHPSIVTWSIGNEILADEQGVSPDRVAMMTRLIREMDPTRPVGMGCHIPEHVDANIFESLDLTGWNYGRRYGRYRDRYPDRPIVYAESASALSTRGFYELPLQEVKTDYSSRHQVCSYDFNAAPWADIPDREFKLMEDDPFVAGEFVWTGFDYLGEPTPFEQRARSSYFGIVDLCGIPKDRYYLYRSYWRPDTPTVHILPHWNWPDRLGQNVPVFVYTNGDAAELFLNGRSLGVQRKDSQPNWAPNLASGRNAIASSSHPSHPPQEAADDSGNTRWCAAAGNVRQWWQIDLGETHPLECFIIDFDREAKNFGYEIKTSVDARDWNSIVSRKSSKEPRWGGSHIAVHRVEERARFVRIVFDEVPKDGGAAMCEFAAYAGPAESSYYAPTYKYRLRWNEVLYEPGELKAVAYDGDSEIGSTIVRTAGKPTAIRLTPDRTSLVASGEDLCYVLVEAIDENGTPCPLADDLIEFAVSGPAEIAAVGNGDPLSMAPFQSDHHRLFYGKAMLIVRTLPDQAGEIQISATSENLAEASVSCRIAPNSSGKGIALSTP
jgi:beta-galactosidase